MVNKQIFDISNSSKHWTIDIVPSHGLFDFRKRDIEACIEKGMINVRFDNGKVFIFLEL